MRSQSKVQFKTAADLRISPDSPPPARKTKKYYCKEVRFREDFHPVPSRSEFPNFQLLILWARFRAIRRTTLGSEHDPKQGLGAVVARRVSALLVSDLTGVVDRG
jgi:hypothetical protein